jgi:hypothetical protein
MKHIRRCQRRSSGWPSAWPPWGPDPLDKVFLLNTGSESNEVGMRLAKLARNTS